MRNFTLIFFILLAVIKLQAQDYIISFSGSGASISVETVKVENLTQGKSIELLGSETLHLLEKVTGINPGFNDTEYSLRIYPNPSNGYCTIEFGVRKSGTAIVKVFDPIGREIGRFPQTVSEGIHSFKISGLSNGIYTINVNLEDRSYSEKLISNSKSSSRLTINYTGYREPVHELSKLKSATTERFWQYNTGDRLKFMGTFGKYSTVVMDIPTNSKGLSFKFIECTDADGNNYPVVQIGTQVWMAENLKTTRYSDGTAIPNVTSNTAWIGLTTGAHCWYNNDVNNKNIYGALYNWYAVNTSKLAPAGWHVPTDAELTTLTNYLGGSSIAGGKIKETGIAHWLSPNTGATNEAGFTAFPGGQREQSQGNYSGKGSFGALWSSTTNDATSAWARSLGNAEVKVARDYFNQNYFNTLGLSIRCVQYILDSPSVSTAVITNLTATSATSGGNVTSDGGATVTARGICWSTNQNPTTANSKTTDGTGTGSFTSNLTGLKAATTYYVRSYAVNSQGTTYGSEVTLKTYYGTVTDVDGNVYLTVKIGDQIWMAENLKSTKYNDGSVIPNVTDNTIWLSLTTDAYCWYNNDLATYKATYGALYNWNAVSTGKLAPIGWHVPTDAEWTILTDYLGGTNVAGGKLKETGTAHWQSPNTGASNEYQFTALPGGNRDGGNGSFVAKGNNAYLWSLTEDVGVYAPYYYLNFNNGNIGRYTPIKKNGVSVRCIFGTLSQASLSTTPATNITDLSASVGGNITNDGGTAVTARGVCWSTSQNPTTSNSKTTNGTGTGSFTSNLTGLTAGTTYYVRAYATNNVGTVYGSQISFTTGQKITSPTVTTSAATNITQTSATSGGNVNTDGGAAVTARGVCWSTSQNPTTANSKTTNSNGTGNFSSDLTGLTANTLYYVRAYATNSVGTTYGNEIFFTTGQNINSPAVFTTAATNVSQTTAISGGNVISDGGATVTARGVCWSTSSNPTTSNNKTTDGTGTGTFVSSITGLTAGTAYYVRAYATNSAGTAYGDQQSFTTLTLPTVSTSSATNIVQTTASSGGNISSDGGASVTARGVCWSTSLNPTTSNSKTTDGSGTGSFSSSLTGLTANTLYHIRAYATNSAGTSYGSDLTFTSLANPVLPSITTAAISNIAQTTATCGGNVTSDGGATVSSRGVCWSINQNPTIADSKTTDGTGTGSFTSNLTDLTEGTSYYVRAYATNSAGTAYGSQVTFNTITIPAVTTTSTTNITQTTATSGGNVSSDGGTSVIARGVCWNTSSNPTVTNSKTSDGSGTGIFTSNLTSLTANTLYYVRAYATNSVGTTYGNEIFFTTGQNINSPTVTTIAVSGVAQTNATSGGNVTSDGGGSVTARGVCWSISSNPTTSNNKTTDGSGTGTFTSNITGLTAGTLYYVRAYATNSVGTAYGDQQSFTTLALPTLTTTATTNAAQTTATSGGNVTFDGGASITARGVCWGTSLNPTTANSKTADGTGTGSFISSLTGLTANTLYHVRAYATNSIGTSYGSDLTFTTLANPVVPTLTTTAATTIAQTNATSGGNITSDGGASITDRGVCWSTSQNPTTANSKTIDGSGLGIFTSNLTSLTANTKYYVRAYATNSAGNAYGNEIFFTTPQIANSPTISTTSVTNIAQTTATSGGNITSDGGAIVTIRGVCWSTSSNPTTANSKTSDGTGTASFTSNLTGLMANTIYYIRAYATNSTGTSYGDQKTFTTLVTQEVPTITTTAITNIAQTTATSGGNITFDGNSPVTARGVCWSMSQNPTTSSSKTIDGTGTGSYTSNLTGLAANTTYYVRAYATNANGTAYGNQVTFTTINLPAVTTTSISSISQIAATGGGNVTSDGGTSVIERGICWSTFSVPLATGNHTSDGSGTGTFVSSITGLTAGTLYYVRAYATNSAGTAYGSEIAFTTINTPTLTTTAASNIAQTTATSGGNVTSDGGVTVIARGICWSTSQNPTTANSKTSDGTGAGIFTSNITGLTAGTTYYVRAYATNSLGTTYGTQISFITITRPSVTTTAITNITQMSATSGGNITSDGGAIVTSRGICWGTSPGTTILGNHTSDGTGIGIFESNITGLLPNILYYVRAYAINSTGTTYGNEISFTTLTLPIVKTNENYYFGRTLATSGGIIISDAGSQITQKGVCWSTNQNPTTGNSKTSDGPYAGSFTSYITGLTEGTTYYVRAYATNSLGTVYGSQVSFKTTIPVADFDGNVCSTVIIGTQEWMAENLKTTHYNDGTKIGTWGINSDAYCWYNNDYTNYGTYGALYNWNAVKPGKLCPIGWHVPSDEDWKQMEIVLGMSRTDADRINSRGTDQGQKLKETSSWVVKPPPMPQDMVGTNISCFSALGMSYRAIDFVGYFGEQTYFWTSTENDSSKALTRYLYYTHNKVDRYIVPKSYGLSVRCVKD